MITKTKQTNLQTKYGQEVDRKRIDFADKIQTTDMPAFTKIINGGFHHFQPQIARYLNSPVKPIQIKWNITGC
jgi:hypothetical protein